MQKIGQGNVTSGTHCHGVLREVKSIPDVLRLMQEDLSDVVVFSREASATAVTPLFPKIKGVVCTLGGPTSHLAIVAREFDLACIMGSNIEYDGELDGCRVSFNSDGEIFLET